MIAMINENKISTIKLTEGDYVPCMHIVHTTVQGHDFRKDLKLDALCICPRWHVKYCEVKMTKVQKE